MSNEPQPAQAGPDFHSITTLSTRVSGIVFWGLVAVGLLFSVFVIGGEEARVAELQRASVDRLVTEIGQRVISKPTAGIAALGTFVKERLPEYPTLRDVSLELDGASVDLGQPGANLDCYPRTLSLPALDAGVPRTVQMTFCLEPVKLRVVEQRRNLVLTIGALFVIFGLFLQRILDALLARPFRRMVHTAYAISNGDEQARFQESSADEFAYLGRFINQALDYSMEQRNALNSALAHVSDAERKLFEEKEKAVVTLHSIGDAVITTNANGQIEYMNPIAEQLTGWPLRDAAGCPHHTLLRFVEEVTNKPLNSSVERCLSDGETIVCERQKLLLRRDGAYVPVSESVAPIFDQHKGVTGAVMVFRDVSQTRRMAQRLSYQASHDPLTGLFNRREFEARLSRLIDDARDTQSQHALCYIDLDQFKVVNDVCGHGAGDELLRQLSEVLQSQVRDTDVLARLGGDEFGVLLTHCSLKQAARIADNMRAALASYRFQREERSFEVGASIGIVEINAGSRSGEELLGTADMACYAAKDGGRNRIHIHTPSDAEVARRRSEMNWLSEVRMALDENRFTLYFQPILPANPSVSAPAHYELLLRMERDNEVVLPMAFIPAAERYRLMPEVDRWVVSNAISFLGAHRFAAPAVCLINLSGQSLCDVDFIDYLENSLARASLGPVQLCFEISERAVISNLRGVSGAINRLRSRGCRFALDDFGGGLASMSRLRELGMDYVKLDGMFVKNMEHNHVDAAMVRAVNELAHAMGVVTIAEMVENEEIYAAIRALGVDYYQGHAIARPLPLAEMAGHQQKAVTLTLVT